MKIKTGFQTNGNNFIVDNTKLEKLFSDFSLQFNKELTPVPYKDETTVFGRSEIINDILQSFNDTQIIILQGLAGIGKSTIAKLYVNPLSASPFHK